MKFTVDETLRQLTVPEKAILCSGLDNWHTKPIDRLDVPSLLMTDGPHGLRKQVADNEFLADNISLPATCFPTACSTACSFDRDLLRRVGVAMAEEMLREGISVILGPGVNIKRSPLCGRNFEYFSEDPLLAGEMAAAMIQGIQSLGVGACIKHFAGNNQEKARFINDSIIDERALREIYLPAFEIAIKKTQPWAIMCAYNKLNGTYMCENRALLTDIARYEWGFEGAIMTDWGAMNERVPALAAGLDLEMPYVGPQRDQQIAQAVENGHLDEAVLDRSVRRMLQLVEKSSRVSNWGQPYDLLGHDALARQAAAESAVLLKNDGILPLAEGNSLAVIGEFAEKPRYQGAGSSKINPHRVTDALETLGSEGIPFTYARGYDLEAKADPQQLIDLAVEAARGKQAVVVFAGLPDAYESEGFDRTHIDLPEEQNQLIEQLAKANPNLVVVLHNGSAVRLPWLDGVRAVLLMGLGGQAVGAAVVDLLTGKVNPSGKLCETYPVALEDAPAQLNFGERLVSEYRESIYVGYRYYEKAQKAVRFPFGFGLSYTSFEYSDLSLSAEQIGEDESLVVLFKVRNTGDRAGKEVVQVYVAAPPSAIFKPVKELRAFEKLLLAPGEQKEVRMALDRRAFAYWNVPLHDWHVESGEYRVLVGASSADIRLQGAVHLHSAQEEVAVPAYREEAPLYYNLPAGRMDIPQAQFEVLIGGKVRRQAADPQAPFTLNSTLVDVKQRGSLVGRLLIRIFEKEIRKMSGGEMPTDESMQRMMLAMVYDMPLRSFSMSGLPLSKIEGLVDLLNGRLVRGLRAIRKGRKEKGE